MFCKPLQTKENQAVIEDEIAFVEGRTIRRFSTQIRDESDRYFGRLYIFEEVTERKRVEQDRVIIRMTDNGPGITTDAQERLFDPFFTTKPPGKGTGLGLSISYQIVVDRHQGKLWCHSAPDHGTEFAIELPIIQH